jgi:3-oxoacyl-ACP reductase-like protein
VVYSDVDIVVVAVVADTLRKAVGGLSATMAPVYITPTTLVPFHATHVVGRVDNLFVDASKAGDLLENVVLETRDARGEEDDADEGARAEATEPEAAGRRSAKGSRGRRWKGQG